MLSDPEIMGGTPCFRGTRVPVQALFDYLEHGHPLDEFLDEHLRTKKSGVAADTGEPPVDRPASVRRSLAALRL